MKRVNFKFDNTRRIVLVEDINGKWLITNKSLPMRHPNIKLFNMGIDPYEQKESK